MARGEILRNQANAPKSSEAAEQEAVVEYCDVRHIPIVHIPNEGKRSVSYAAQLKRAGMRKGFPDLFVPLAREGFHGLFVEMKPTFNHSGVVGKVLI